MQTVLGVLFSLYWLIYFGQVISVANLSLARRLGLQESVASTDQQYRRDTAYTARWDVLSMWALPLAGSLMLLDHPFWPFLATIGGALCLDSGSNT